MAPARGAAPSRFAARGSRRKRRGRAPSRPLEKPWARDATAQLGYGPRAGCQRCRRRRPRHHDPPRRARFPTPPRGLQPETERAAPRPSPPEGSQLARQPRREKARRTSLGTRRAAGRRREARRAARRLARCLAPRQESPSSPRHPAKQERHSYRLVCWIFFIFLCRKRPKI